MQQMQFFFVLVDTETCSTFQPTLKFLTAQLLGDVISVVLVLLTLATHRFTLLVFLFTVTTSQNLLLCLSHSVTTDVFGFLRKLATIVSPLIFLMKKEITT